MGVHHHANQHHHEHGHHDLKGRSLVISIFLNMAITVAQVLGALVGNSLSLLSDALHNFSDVMALVLSWVANRLSRRNFTATKSFGYKRAEIVAAFLNAATLLALSVYLIIESVSRLMSGATSLVDGELVAWLAGFSILANGASVLLVRKHSHHNMNMRSVYLHLFSDMLSSVAVLLGGLAIRFWGVLWLDALLSIGIAVYLIFTGWQLFVKTLKVLMQFTPAEVDVEGIALYINGLKGVENLHHVHVWQLNDAEYHFEGHIDFKDDVLISEANRVMVLVVKELKEVYSITHCTLQPEFKICEDKALIRANHND